MILSNDSLVAFHYRSYGTFFLHKIGSIISIGDLPTTNIIEPKKVESGMTFPDFFDRMKLKKTLSKEVLLMEHLFKFLFLAPYFYFDNWIEKANRNSKFFPIFYYFYWIYITLYALFSLAWTVFSVLFFNILLRNVADIKSWGIWLLLLLIAFSSSWLTYIFFKKMLRLRRELGKSKGGRH